MCPLLVSVGSLWLQGRQYGEGRTKAGTERDSAKDEAVVFIFIFATVGLLLYAALRPWIDQWISVSYHPPYVSTRVVSQAPFNFLELQNARERRTYIPVSEGGI